MGAHWGKRKLIYGWGINDLPYVVKPGNLDKGGKRVAPCPYYDRWIQILKRVKSERNLALSATYRGSDICLEWKRASSFKSWMKTQIWYEPTLPTALQLDKDILGDGGKLYSPDTCCFVPQALNSVLIVADNDIAPGVQRSGYKPKFVCPKYKVSITHRNAKVWIGEFDSVEKAHAAWQVAKIKRLEEELAIYRKMLCYREDVDEAFYKRIILLQNDLDSGVITRTLNI